MNKINRLYAAWDTDRTEDNLNFLLSTVRQRIINRYCLIDQNNCDDIAQRAIVIIWRSMPGYAGDDALTSFRPEKVQFALFCAQIARRERFNILRHERLTATKHDTLEGLVSDIEGQATGY
jgi:DNA-directed RNA polymerase specialized sigma24 family protein